MEYIIIFILLIFLIIIILKKQIQLVRDINKDYKKSIINYNKFQYLNKNPILLYLYEKLYLSLKKFNKYDYKKYIIFNNIKISENDKCILDWCSFTGGLINMSIDTSIKYIKQKKNIPSDFIDNLAQLKLFYKMFYFKKNNENTNKKYIKYKNNKVILNLLYINDILIQIYNDIIINIKKDNIMKLLKENKTFYLCNLYLNNKLDKKYIDNKKSKFNEYIKKIL
jgi:hypothetical protein